MSVFIDGCFPNEIYSHLAREGDLSIPNGAMRIRMLMDGAAWKSLPGRLLGWKIGISWADERQREKEGGEAWLII